MYHHFPAMKLSSVYIVEALRERCSGQRNVSPLQMEGNSVFIALPGTGSRSRGSKALAMVLGPLEVAEKEEGDMK